VELLSKIAKATVSEDQRFLLTNCVETYLQLVGREADEYAALRRTRQNSEIDAMELTWADRMAIQYTQKGMEQGVKKGLRQGVKQGLEQGVKKGVKQGVRKGVEQGVRDTLLHLLAKRFGKISPAVRGRVEAIGSLEELTGLVDRILEVKSIEELGLGS
jgi:flagellar biosynthesis/type III secretory pathway protein FliH